MIRHQVKAVFAVLLVVLSLGAAAAPAAAAQENPDDIDREELIDQLNDGVATTNERMETDLHPRLENADPPEPMEPIEGYPESEAELQNAYDHISGEVDRLSVEILHAVVEEINLQAEERGIERPLDPANIQTPEEAREAGDQFYEDFGHIDEERAGEARDGLHEAATSAEELNDRFEDGLAALETMAYQDAEMGTVSGTVTDGDDEPIEGVTVSPESGPGEATTDADGAYEIEIVAGENTLSFTHGDYEEVEESVDVGAGESQTRDVSMSERGGDDEDDEAGGLLDTLLSTGGLALSGLAIAGVVGVGAFGALREDEGSDTLRAVAGTVGLMVASGVAIGGAGYLTINWALNAFPGQEGILGQIGPLIGLMTVFLVAPALAVLLGLTRKAGGSGRGALVKGLFACMAGAVLLVLLAMALIGESQAGESSVETIDAVSVAGIVATVSALAYTVATVVNEKVSGSEPAAGVSTAD